MKLEIEPFIYGVSKKAASLHPSMLYAELIALRLCKGGGTTAKFEELAWV